MQAGLSIAGTLLVVIGAVWILQGIGLLPGSYMNGQMQWAVIGGIVVAAGIAMLVAANRWRKGEG